MNVTLSPDLEELVKAKVQSGRYPTADDVVRAGLELLNFEDQFRATSTAALRSRIDHGLDSLDRGEGVDGETFMAEMLQNLDSAQGKR